MSKMFNRRRYRRRAFSFPARVQPIEGDPIVCTVCDISNTGAYIRAGLGDLPKSFKLILSNDGRIYRDCRVVWREGIEFGLEFQNRPVI